MTHRNSAKSIILITALTLGSKAFGFFREVFIASSFGASPESDAYFVSITLTALISSLISTAVATTFVPVLCEIKIKEGNAAKNKHINNMINLLLLISVILTIAGWFLAPLAMKLLAKGFQPEQYAMAVSLTRTGLPKLLFICLGALTAYLQSEQRHITTAALGIPSNLIIILYLLILSNRYGIQGLMVSGIISVGCQGIIQFAAVKKLNFTYQPMIQLHDPYIHKALWLSAPVFISVAIYDINTVIDRTLASSLDTGSISALNYSEKIISLVLSVFIGAIVTVVFPLLSRDWSRNNTGSFLNHLQRGIHIILLITIPATTGLLILSEPVIKLVFMRGSFDKHDASMASGALIFYALGLVPMALRMFLNKAYYALQDTKSPLVYGGISVVTNVILNLVLVRVMSLNGLALATSIAAAVAAFLMVVPLCRKFPALQLKPTLVYGIKVITASLIMGIFAFYIHKFTIVRMGLGTVAGGICFLITVITSTVIYIAVCYLLSIPEIKAILKPSFYSTKKEASREHKKQHGR